MVYFLTREFKYKSPPQHTVTFSTLKKKRLYYVCGVLPRWNSKSTKDFLLDDIPFLIYFQLLRRSPAYWVESSKNIDAGEITSACLLRRRFIPDSPRENEAADKKQVEEICGIPSEIASLMDSFSCQLRREMKAGKINSWYSHAELDREGRGGGGGKKKNLQTF